MEGRPINNAIVIFDCLAIPDDSDRSVNKVCPRVSRKRVVAELDTAGIELVHGEP